MDTLTPAQRSEIMCRVRGKDTKPEMVVRSLVHHMGYRYRLHKGDLPGRPDLAFPKSRKVIFVHGCYWHRHDGCPNARIPKSRVEFWTSKLEGNKDRDRANESQLAKLGWRYLVIWECELRDKHVLHDRITAFMEDARALC
ncbi:MAG: very short patch repair endonuclease [Syntrophobacteraceae bacterium]|nr:very short patch repair endonuclease [Syntrophobacteraceae bacterium]